jgi:hypothetical protein
VVIYVDDILIYGKSASEIDALIEELKKGDISLHKEGTAEGYLSVDITQNGDTITLLQEGLTKRIISALGLDSKYSTPVDTPAEKAALGRDLEGQEASGSVNYQSHEDALIRIGRYLKGTLHNGLVLTPSDNFKIDCYPDADFAGLWG